MAAVPKAAGVLVRNDGGQVLFLKRVEGASDQPGTWCLPGGWSEDGETPEQTARRELQEETGFASDGILTELISQVNDLVDFSTLVHNGAAKFTPALDGAEHTEFTWADPKSPPEPLHPGVRAMLTSDAAKVLFDCSSAQDDNVCAMDEAPTSRTYDDAGRLHVLGSNISKANISPYVGREIPDYEQLGLDPKRVYQLLRDPEELEKAAESFNRVPLLSKHEPTSAASHPEDLTVGAISNARWEDPYVRADLVVWPGDAIRDIESQKKRQLSSGYRYRADMTPGTWKGVKYDGVMRDISGNHVALVKDGRAGADVIVGDEATTPKGEYGSHQEAGYADPGYQRDQKPRYPLKKDGRWDEGRIKSAWNYINHPGNSAEYSKDDRAKIKDQIASAWKEHIDSAGPPSAADANLAADSKESIMGKTLLSRKAAMVQGAVIAHLAVSSKLPKLAMDKALDITPAFAGVDAKNYKAKKADIVKGLRKELKLAQDADMDDITALLDALDPVDPDEQDAGGAAASGSGTDDGSSTANAAVPVAIPEGEQRDGAAKDADPLTNIKTFLAAQGVPPEVLAQLDALMVAPAAAAPAGQDVDPGAAGGTPPMSATDKKLGKDKKMGKDADPAGPTDPKDMVTKGAMDEAITAAVTREREAAAARTKAIREAERHVRPRVGELIAQDSAEGVYRTAFKAIGMNVEKVPAEGLSALWDAVPSDAARKPRIAMDAAPTKGFAERYPDAARIGQA